MKARKSFWLVLLSVIVTSAVVISGMSFGPPVVERLAPRAVLAEDLPPEVASPAAQISGAGTLHTLSIPPAAFSPTYSGQDYYNASSMLTVHSGTGFFTAPVYLPQGARVVKLVAFANDNQGSYNEVILLGRAFQNSGSNQVMANVASSNSSTVQRLVDDSILYSTIDNSLYSYYVSATMYGPNLYLMTTKIVYLY